MSEILLIKSPQGYLIPSGDEDIEKVRRFRVGAVVRAEVKQVRNYKFLQKMHCLFKLSYDHFCEHGTTAMEYKGQKVVPSYDRFRYDLIILAGHYTPVFNIRGELRLEAKSISYGKCSEEDAEKIYSDCINAALKNVYQSKMDEAALREMVDRLLAFA